MSEAAELAPSEAERASLRPVPQPKRILSYFKLEGWPLTIVTVSGILYNVGMTAGPYFEGQLAQCLYDILQGRKQFSAMLTLALTYLLVILGVQLMRCLKRFYVRRFANDTSRNMRHMLYNSLVHMTKEQLEGESLGAVMTKAVADVDACVEGVRKFTTEVFDTGVVLLAYLGLLFYYDARLAFLACIFTPVAYFIAERLKTLVTRYNAAYKNSAGKLNTATMDRVTNALTYRVYGCEQNRDQAFEGRLQDYEHKAVAANIWEGTMQPLYNLISMGGVLFILYFGSRNVLGTGWTQWNVASFTTFLACFAKLALKSSTASKLFNAVQKAQVSWGRVQPLMQEYVWEQTDSALDFTRPVELTVQDAAVQWPGAPAFLQQLSFTARPGQIIGITGAVASGKSLLGKAFIGEAAYTGSIKIGSTELRNLSLYERSRLISYTGHEPELMSDSIAENIQLGVQRDVPRLLEAVCLQAEVAAMPAGTATSVGSSGVRLSGGQQARLALARTLAHARKILILDDPFAAVDRGTERELFAHLRQLAREQVVLLISHRLYLFPQLDKVLFLENGTGVFATHEELLQTKGSYRALYQAQTQGGDLDEH